MNSIESLLDSNISYAFAWAMLHSLWQCILIAVALFVSLKIMRSASAQARYLMGISAMILCVVASASTFIHYFESAESASSFMVSAGIAELQYRGGVWETIYTYANRHLETIILLWTVGFIVQFYRYLGDYWRAFQLKSQDCSEIDHNWVLHFTEIAEKLGLHKAIAYRQSARVSGICVVGHFKPVVLLPVGLLMHLGQEEVEALILHELAHIKRNDYLVNALQCFVKVVYFFNPAVLWISSQIDRERENACDDIAVKECGNRMLYAKSLSKVSELELRLASVMAANNNRFMILPRIQRLFSNKNALSRPLEQLLSALCVSIIALTMNVNASELKVPQPAPVINTVKYTLPAAAPVPVREEANLIDDVVVAEASSARDFINNKDASNKIDQSEVIPEFFDLSPKPLARLDEQNLQLAQLGAGSISQGKKKKAVVQSDLERVETKDFSEFWVASSVIAPSSNKIYIEIGESYFAQKWLDRYSSKAPASYRQSTLQQYTQALKESLSEALTASNWEVLDQPSDDAITLHARLIDVFVFAPDSVGLKETIISSAGQSGVEIEVKVPSGQTLMKIKDYRQTKDNDAGFLANRATNYHYFKLVMDYWADSTSSYLGVVKNILEQ
jgi:beta-lactamase regulating signal transducer with metallopeptidase domain